MPKREIDYKKIVFYRIRCFNTEIKDNYIGYTTNLVIKKAYIKKCCQKCVTKDNITSNNLYKIINSNGGYSNWSIDFLENYPCDNILEIKQRLQYWCNLYNANLSTKKNIE